MMRQYKSFLIFRVNEQCRRHEQAKKKKKCICTKSYLFLNIKLQLFSPSLTHHEFNKKLCTNLYLQFLYELFFTLFEKTSKNSF
jgi:hypothetical protein